MLEACHGLVSIGRSDHLEPLRGRTLPLVFRDRFSFGPWEVPTDRAIDFNFDEVKQAFVAEAEAEAAGRYIAGLHFILAEEAYEQAVHLARYEALEGEDSIHRHSRLLAAIYHGAASLGSHELELELQFKGAGQFLPDNPVDRWIKLYGFAYRRNLDRSPGFHLVRMYDAAQTKHDLLLSLAQPRLCRDSGSAAPLRLPKVTIAESSVTPIGKRRNILRRFTLELRRSAAAISRDLEIDWTAGGLAGESDDEAQIKLGEDIRRLTLDETQRPEDIERLNERTLQQIEKSFNNHATQKYLKFVEKHVRALMGNADRTELIGPKLQAAIFAKSGLLPDKLLKLTGYLNFYAEILAVKADRDFNQSKSQGKEVTGEIIDGFIASFAAYYIAEYFRNRHFLDSPLSYAEPIRGRAARGLIRVALKLERFRSSMARGTRPSLPPGGWFWKYAHAISDEIARNLAQFPRERVAILTQEATLARYYTSRDSPIYPQFLAMATQSLLTAEPVLMKLGLHGQLRQRFLFERTKVLGESARLEIAEGKWDRAENNLAICASDVEEFRLLSTDGNVHWPNLATRYNAKIAGLRRDLAQARSGVAAPRGVTA